MGKGQKINGLDSLEKVNFSHGAETDPGESDTWPNDSGEVGNNYPVGEAGLIGTVYYGDKYPVDRAGCNPLLEAAQVVMDYIKDGVELDTHEVAEELLRHEAVRAIVSNDLQPSGVLVFTKSANKRTVRTPQDQFRNPIPERNLKLGNRAAEPSRERRGGVEQMGIKDAQS